MRRELRDLRARRDSGASFASLARAVPAFRRRGPARRMQLVERMLLKEIMRRDPMTARETERLGDLHRMMTKAHIRHLPVVRDGRLIGMLTEHDILEFRARVQDDVDWWRAPVSEAMTRTVQTASPDDSLTEVAGRLAAAKIGALPVVELGKLIGLVTVTDVLEAEVRSAMG